jgi:hypothetical protein
MLFMLMVLAIGFGMVAIVINLPHAPGMVTAPAEDWFGLAMKAIVKTAAASEAELLSCRQPSLVPPEPLERPDPPCGNPACAGDCLVCDEYQESLAWLQGQMKRPLRCTGCSAVGCIQEPLALLADDEDCHERTPYTTEETWDQFEARNERLDPPDTQR